MPSDSYWNNRRQDADVLKYDDIPEKEKKEFLDIIDSNAKQLLSLIDEIIDVAKIEAGEFRVSKGECDVNKMMSELELNFNKLAENKEKNIKYINESPRQKEDLIIRTDCLRLRQVLSNLLQNALKFTPKGTVRFNYKINKKTITFRVKDTGIGIPQDKLSMIFERFKQVNYESKSTSKGTGLGLAICKGVVEALGGKISVSSAPNNGAEFVFSLPLELVETKQKDSKPVVVDINFKDRTFLIAEDDRRIVIYFKEIFKKTGAHILWASNGQEAIDMYSHHPEIDIVLMDINMPILNGFDATKAIIKMNPEAIIIAQTAYVMANEKDKCFEIGCKDYVSKPIYKSLLYSKINKWLD